ncbi:protein yippee-like [Pyrus ussuriensis x Pyrus communis]|uniref:Protein yippee-like n=1 Tax=Pyrus ussuriensis x Pyrus communis TaxID=2448454 RepID=A0A5N5FE61_9ROSA|nr:protein yippee-like At5g53940 isoform X2 [Pyrus x bretschneideri]XP_048447366.1 protein yippee-like At5g53940 isoform X2 [Pyrus x bretschneideri]KAB2601247.1 protein yippee-like [Pyrus ussuriensis x Pyrus communis]
MGRIFLIELDGRTYRCRFCDSALALAGDVLSRIVKAEKSRSSGGRKPLSAMNFNCGRRRAYLFSNVVNITLGPEEERLMLSGLHTVEDIFCCCCGQILGWKYVIAHDQTQKYKEGKFVLERWRIVEDVAELFNLDARLGSSDAESP